MPGLIGALPPTAWRELMGLLSMDQIPEPAWRAAVLELRRACHALRDLVGELCVGGAGWLDVETEEHAAQLEEGPTAGFGRALVVRAMTIFAQPEQLQLATVEALTVAVRRGHMIRFGGSPHHTYTSTAVRAIETILAEASREDQLLRAEFEAGWSPGTMSELCSLVLSAAEYDAVATITNAGALQSVELWNFQAADVSVLSGLREVSLYNCIKVDDLTPLADVPRLAAVGCPRVTALPAMRNDWLSLSTSAMLTDLSGLAGGRVGRLELEFLNCIEDMSAIGAMQRPPRTVSLAHMIKLHDLSMLAGVRRLEVVNCPLLDKAATLAALADKVGTILWRPGPYGP